MGSKICMNASCGTTTTREWKSGWPLRSGGYADLCSSCGSAYENSVYCDTFHSDESGWRDCSICGKHLHCGCIASQSLLELLDYGGVGCSSCAKSSQVHAVQSNKVSNGFGPLKVDNTCDLESTTENRLIGNRVGEGKLAELCRFIEASENNLLHQPEGTYANACLGKFGQEEVTHSMREVGTGFKNVTQSTAESSKFAKTNNVKSVLDMRDVRGFLAQPSLSMNLGAPLGTTNFLHSPGGVDEGMEQGKKSSPSQQGQRSRPILPKPLKPAMGSEVNKAVGPELRIARPPAEGRGKNQLLPRYWPRITDQELQQLAGDLNSKIVPLFEKVLSASDAGRIGRLVLPKACAEAYFPPISQSEGVPLRIQDVKGREWTFQFRFWPNNNSRMYVLEGVTPCIQAMQLQAGDTITFSRIDPGGKLVVGFRRATNSFLDAQDTQTSALPNGSASGEPSFSADGDIGWRKSEKDGGSVNGNSLQQPMTASEKKRTRNIGPKSKRFFMHSEDALELRLTWEEAQDLLRPPSSVKPTIVTIEDHEFEEYDVPPVFGKRTIFTARPFGGQEQWAQCDDCSKWRKLPVDALLPPKWICSENVWDSSRSTCLAPEEISLKQLDNLMRVSKDFKKRRNFGSHKSFQECEPSGLDALASAAVLGDKAGDSGETSVGATTKHPRHRPGCTCIVCIQPPSGKGKHRPTCICNVCLTVKRRFKTLMLRKKKRQSEHEVGTSHQKDDNLKDESKMNGAMSHEALPTTSVANEAKPSGKQIEVAESSAGQIDLNCDPNREDMQLDVPGLSMMNLVNAVNLPLDNYSKQNGLAGAMCEQQPSLDPSLLSQTNRESLRRLTDEAFLASIGWDHGCKGD